MNPKDEEVYIPSCAFFFAAIGLILSLVSNFYCGYASTNITITELIDGNNITTATSEPSSLSNPLKWRAGIWNYEDHDIYYVQNIVDLNSGEIYFVRYYYCVPWTSRTRITPDVHWTTAQVFSIISVVLGGCIAFTSCCITCSDTMTMSRSTMISLAFCYLFIVLCQGLTFLYFTSTICQNNASANVTHGGDEYQLQWDGCDRSSGANCGIASIVFYFVSSLILLSAASVGRRRGNDVDGWGRGGNYGGGDGGNVMRVGGGGGVARSEGEQQEQ
jgi:hypothetical protein